MVTEATRRTVWNDLLDVSRVARYAEAMGSRYRARHPVHPFRPAGRRVGQHGDVPGRSRRTVADRLRPGDSRSDRGGFHARLRDQDRRIDLDEEGVQHPRGRVAGALARRGLARVHGRRDSASQQGTRPAVRAGDLAHGRTGSRQQQDERAVYEGRLQGHRGTVCFLAAASKSAPAAVRVGPPTSLLHLRPHLRHPRRRERCVSLDVAGAPTAWGSGFPVRHHVDG